VALPQPDQHVLERLQYHLTALAGLEATLGFRNPSLFDFRGRLTLKPDQQVIQKIRLLVDRKLADFFRNLSDALVHTMIVAQRTQMHTHADLHCMSAAGPIALRIPDTGGATSPNHALEGGRYAMVTYNILMMGASYGSLLASKLLFGGHSVHLVCLPAEADLINAEGFRVRLPVKGRKEQVEIDSRKLPGKVTAGGAAGIDPRQYHLVGLAMQEPQYRSPGVRELLDAVAKSRVPCMSIMNMPPLPYVKRIPGLDHNALKPAYTDASVWDSFDPGAITLNSPDPQAIRPPEEKVNVLQVTLPTNFKVARFADDRSTAILRHLEKDIDAVRFEAPEGRIELPVKLRVHDSIFVPLAKWAMLLAGNYRCVTRDGMRTAQEAVHSDIEASRSVYTFVNDLCVKLGAAPGDLVPFEKYAAAAQSLTRPASAARALNNGAPNIERADKLVQLIARQKGLSHPVIDATVALVDARLEANRKKAAA
jgi:hypothetical protein